MSLTGLITFIAGTKAKAQEVNNNFTVVKSFVDGLETDIAQNTIDIQNLQDDKADINGDATARFSVADAINDTDAINKRTLFKYTHNSQRFIEGLDIAKTGSNVLSIQAGSAMDSTFTHIMILSTSVSLTNSTQASNSTYYLYLISKEDGTTQCIVSTDSVTPSLPTGYLYFRQIGKYSTNADNHMYVINGYNTAGIAKTQSAGKFPDLFNGVTRNMYPVLGDGASGSYNRDDYKYKAETDLWLVINRPFGFGLKVSSNNSSYTSLMYSNNSNQGFYATSGFVPIPAGTWYYAYPNGDLSAGMEYTVYPALTGI